MQCAVCSAQVIESHFGAMVCRSCSAFFRRYVLTKKKRIACKAEKTCSINHNIRKMCRFCRMAKCLQVGMIPTRINEPIISKNTDKILEMLSNYSRLQEERLIAYGMSDEKVNFSTATTIMEANYGISRKHIERLSKEFTKLSKKNQNALFDHYYTGCIVAENLYCAATSEKSEKFRVHTGRETLPIEQYFLGENKNTYLTDIQINEMFKPFWINGMNQVVKPLLELKLNTFEITALFGLMLFDGSSKGIDDDCVEICYKIRNIIFREITAYHRETEHSRSFDRMADIMYALTLMMRCAVCNAKVIESHFGAMVCRACAAFFRRYVIAKSSLITCSNEKKCVININVKKMCRFCRMAKCLKVGMAATRIEDQIILKSTDKILAFMKNYPRLQEDRMIVHGHLEEKINFSTATTIMEADYRISRNLIERSFKEFGIIRKNSRNAIFDHFYTRFIVAESAFNVVNSNNTENFRVKTGHETLPIDKFFLGENKKTKLTDDQINIIFEPFWRKSMTQIIKPFIELKLDEFEFTAMLAIMLFDGSYSRIDDNCSKMCYRVRNIIFREISSYHKEIDHPRSFDRMADIMYAITLMEKSRQIVSDQLTLSCLFNLDHNEQICQIFKETSQ
ncbi:unnamed protein product [Caenorhabditis angaria]|uniref:Nuclear receptor domain-containing protein n=1 Tax=Caenorhabditis angaria TaxID=860376 RepID=A0A9P1N4Y9_9PELO|nr:unnamed protein product [Caenorhabditis angaria]